MKGRLRNVKIEDFHKNFALVNSDFLKNLPSLKQKFNKFIVEFCSGTGDFLVNYAALEKDTFFLGIDYAENAIFRAVKKAFNNNLENCKFFNGYIQHAIEYFENNFFDIIYISFPDPWPKKRHTNRRLVTKEFLNYLFNLIKDEGYCIIITDNIWYQKFIDEELLKIENFTKYFEQSWWTDDEDEFLQSFKYFPSNYYKKAKENGSNIRYYILRKKMK